MFHHDDGKDYIQALPGITRKTLVHGMNTLMTRFNLGKGSELPFHNHPQEQTGFLVSGRMRLTIGDETLDLVAGDSWTVPGDVAHGAVVLEDSVAIEVFSPVREDYLK